MLKKCYKLFLGLLIVTGSACVSPTHASSASIIIANIRAGSQVSAAEEGIVLYNNSSFGVDVTNWCLTNKSAVKFACFMPLSQYELSIIPAYSYATVVSTKAVNNENQANFSIVFESSASSSGSIVASTDTISLVDASAQLVDQFSWTSSVSSSQQWVRTKLSQLPDLFIDTNTPIDWQKLAFSEFPIGQLEYQEVEGETTPEESGDEPAEGPGDQSSDVSNENQKPASPPVGILPAIITELLPNAVGSDAGNEFIEIYNPNPQSNISLNGYKLAVGPALEKVIILSEYILKPGEYKVLTNAALGYSLLNTSSRVTLFMPAGEIGSEVPAYSSPPDGESWALIEDTWQYTNRPTPGMVNAVSLSDSTEAQLHGLATSSVKACAFNQYRNTETNRCRLISSANSTSPTTCKVGQERNLETNRCRNITSTATNACKQGQAKNPETNRCRTIKQLSTATFGIKGATTKQQGGTGWYMWAAIVGIALLIIGYAAWEWRSELKQLIKDMKAKFAGKPN